MMESSGTRAVGNDIRKAFPNKKLHLTHDGDNKSKKIFDDIGVDVEHSYDLNHGRGALQRAFTSFKKELLYAHKIRSPFHGIEKRIITWAQWLFENISDPEERVKHWLNTPMHLIGRHENCIHPDMLRKKPDRPRRKKEKEHKEYYLWKKGLNNPILVTYLQKYCELLTPYIRNAATKSSTNPNESLNASICTTAPKRLALGSSYEARAGIAIGLKNDPEYFIPNLLEATGMKKGISQDIYIQKCNEYKKRKEMYQKRNSPKERKKENVKRIQIRSTYPSKKTDNDGDYNENKEEVIVKE